MVGTRTTLTRGSRVGETGIYWHLLGQVIICVFPAMVLFALGHHSWGSRWCFLSLGMFLGWYLLMSKRFCFIALLLAVIPALSYLRGFFIYHAVGILLGLGIVLWYLVAPREFYQLWRNSNFRILIIIGTFYWVLSYSLTQKYNANLRIFELMFSAACVYLLAGHRKYFATAFLGMGITLGLIGITFWGASGRLGYGTIGGRTVGNPITFGVPVALVFLLATADKGKWLFLEKRDNLRRFIQIVACGFLLLSTSRGSWAIVILGMFVLFIFHSKYRIQTIVGIFVIACVGLGILQFDKSGMVQKFVDKSTSTEKGLSKMTTGRSQQWMLFPSVLSDSPLWGHGPGSGPSMYGKFSALDNEITFRRGKTFPWHSLYLHVGVETGLIGLLMLGILLGGLASTGVRHLSAYKEIMPLLGVVGYMTIGLSVLGMDPHAGLFLGFALLGKSAVRKKLRAKPISYSARTSKPYSEAYSLSKSEWCKSRTILDENPSLVLCEKI